MPVIPVNDDAKTSLPARCEVIIKGTTYTREIDSLVIEQHIDRHHEAVIMLSRSAVDATEVEDPDDHSKFLGESISISIKPEKGFGDEELKFTGLVTEVSFENSIDAINVISIYAKSPTIVMDGAKKNAFFSEQKASDLISSTVRAHPITAGSFDSTKIKYRHILQYNETDYEFVMRLASTNGLYAFYDGEKFHAIAPNSNGPVKLSWRQHLGSFSVGLGTSQPEYNSQLFDYEQTKDFKQDSKSVSQTKSLSALTDKSPKASKKIFKDSSFMPVYHQVDDAKSLDEILKYKRDGAQSKMTRCKGQSLMPTVKVGKCVQISGMNDKFDNSYWVTAVTHIIGQGGKYHNKFQCIPFDIAHPEYIGDRNRGALIQTGIVTDNADPDKLGRVKVKFPWVQGETFWTRYLSPHAGDKHGWYSLPEIDDEVLCAFERGDPDRPVILGSMYNSKSTPPSDSQVEENNVKMFLTKAGNKILVRDEGGKEAIEIVNAEGKNTIVLEAGGPSISIESDGDIAITGANIKIKGSGNVEIEADSDIKEKAGANMEIKAGANMKVEASGTQDVKGAMVNVKGNPINLN